MNEARARALALIAEGNELEDSSRLSEALATYEASIAIEPDLARAHLNRGNALAALDRDEDAIDAYRTAARLDPDYAAAHHNLANALSRTGANSEAADSYRRAIRLKEDFADALVGLAIVLDRMHRHDELAETMHAANRLTAASAEAMHELGVIAARNGLLADAAACYERALVLDPAQIGSIVNLGSVYLRLGEIDKAIDCQRRALAMDSRCAPAHGNLGDAFREGGAPEQAIACYRRALQIDPRFAHVAVRLGNVLTDTGRFVEAGEAYRDAISMEPDFQEAYTGLLFCLSHDETVEPHRLFAEHCRFGDHFESGLRGQWPVHHNHRDPGRPLAVGLVSADLRAHPVAYFVEPLLDSLARTSSVTLHAYSNHVVEDAVTARMRPLFATWNRVAGMSDAELAHRIRDHGIDILIDLSGHTGQNRLLTFARKPAPIQASWIGYPGTTGLTAMDYYICDPGFLPVKEFENQFTEKLVHLPASAPFLPDESAPPIGPLPALRNGYVTFGSFNRPSKIGPRVIETWAHLLKSVPASRMLLGAMPPQGSHAELADAFVRHGVDPRRLDFAVRCDTASYLRLHHQVDICLDTSPYSGGTTTAHALWMGVPTLTVAGPTPAARQGAAFLARAGLAEWIADDLDVVARGVAVSRDLATLAELRRTMRQRFAASSWKSPEVIAAGLHSALRIMWQRWCAGQPPAPIDASGAT